MAGGSTAEEVSEQIALEERAQKKRIAALRDGAFIAGVRQALEAAREGERGTPWLEVKRELGITV